MRSRGVDGAMMGMLWKRGGAARRPAGGGGADGGIQSSLLRRAVLYQVQAACRWCCVSVEGVAEAGVGGPRHAVQGLPCAAEMQLQCVSERRGRVACAGGNERVGCEQYPENRNNQHNEQGGRTLSAAVMVVRLRRKSFDGSQMRDSTRQPQ